VDTSYTVAEWVYYHVLPIAGKTAASASAVIIIIAEVLPFVLAFIVVILSILPWIYMRHLGVSYETPDDKRVAILNNPVRRGAYRLYIAGWAVISFFLGSIFLGAFLGVGVWLVGILFDVIMWTTRHWWILPFWCAVAYGLYVFRYRQRALYGTCEVIVGAAAIYFSISQTGNSTSQTGNADFARIISLASGLYVIVRGLDNFDVGKVELADILYSEIYIPIRRIWERWVKFSVASDTAFYDYMIKEREEVVARRRKSEDELKSRELQLELNLE
jgi:hypothetical protein